MAGADYKNYLGASVLNEGQTVSYRVLSRELKVHSNAAKRMLYDFYHLQNAKTSGSVYACYLLDGIRKPHEKAITNGHQIDGEDLHMQSSPFISSMPQQDQDEKGISTKCISLVTEEDLEGGEIDAAITAICLSACVISLIRYFSAVKSAYEHITSIHVYSLSPTSLQNLQVLSDCNRTVSKQLIHEDPLISGQQYGIIKNKDVRRRTGRRPSSVALEISGPEAAQKPDPPRAQISNSQPVAQDAKVSTLNRPKSASMPQYESRANAKPEQPTKVEKKFANKATSIRREQPDVFKSFSKPKPTLKSEETASSIGSAAATPDNSQEASFTQEKDLMENASEDEQTEELSAGSGNQMMSGNSRAERAEELRKMMEDEEGMNGEVEEQPEIPHDSGFVNQPAKPSEISPETTVMVSGDRRRGRRKILKKKTIKDDEGFLVTKEEPAWESFSEDEVAASGEKMSLTASMSSKRKKGGKPGQGNIMNFFGKNS